jgi:hypothetical protein
MSDDLDLEAIRERMGAFRAFLSGTYDAEGETWVARQFTDIDALIAEVERLRASIQSRKEFAAKLVRDLMRMADRWNELEKFARVALAQAGADVVQTAILEQHDRDTTETAELIQELLSEPRPLPWPIRGQAEKPIPPMTPEPPETSGEGGNKA